jgi:glycosyltransferase involved in cell wall biosynthesis
VKAEVVFVHDHLVQRGGSERVLVSMLRAFPGAPVFTSMYWDDATYPELRDADIRCLAIDRVSGLRRHHRAAFPILPILFSRLEVDAPLVICNSSGWSQAVRTTGRKVVYLHALARWVHTPPAQAAGDSVLRRTAVALFGRSLARWDRRTVRSADRLLVAGPAMRERVRDAYDLDAGVLPPPISFSADGPMTPLPGVAPGFYLSVARLVPYKNLDAVAAAFASLPDQRLVVAGAGPEAARLRARAPANVTLVGDADDATLRWLYANCRAIVCAGYEPYGMTPAEAAAFAKPALALRTGGLVDVVLEGRTGEFFERPEPNAIADAVRRLDVGRYDDAAFNLVRHRHAEDAFIAGLRSVAEQELGRTGKRPAT